MTTPSATSVAVLEEYIFVCEAEGAEHWVKHYHGRDGKDPCPNDVEPCGYCGSAMTRFAPEEALAIEITLRELRAHEDHALTVTTAGGSPSLRCDCGARWSES